MATEEENKTDMVDPPDQLENEGGDHLPSRSPSSPGELQAEGETVDDDDAAGQFGHRRFVYAAYFAAAILVAFVSEKTLTFAWTSLAKWKPNFGEPSDEFVMPVSAVIGALVALYFWKRTRTRELAEDVASELAKVTWPTRKEVANNTMVVIFTTAFATVFFTLMDRFWSFVTNWVYGT